jgi:hypothetical protein
MPLAARFAFLRPEERAQIWGALFAVGRVAPVIQQLPGGYVDWWVTPSGTTIAVQRGAEYRKSGEAAVFLDLRVTSPGGQARPIAIRVEDPSYINNLRQAQGLSPLDEAARGVAALVAGIRAVDKNPDFFESPEPLRLDLAYDQLTPSSTPSFDAGRLRRYIARRLYLTWEHGTFDDFLWFGHPDELLTGAGPRAFLRNLQLLEQEGYVELTRTMGQGFGSFGSQPTAKLIREVERYGAAKADVESEEDFAARLFAQTALSAEQPSIMAERQRYELARAPDELASVFRAVAPLLEGIIRRLLRAHGSRREHGSLGPMVGELTERRIGTLGLWSQLSAVHRGARDISLHGEELPVAVLRITTETCFELIPQLGALFPEPA